MFNNVKVAIKRAKALITYLKRMLLLGAQY